MISSLLVSIDALRRESPNPPTFRDNLSRPKTWVLKALNPQSILDLPVKCVNSELFFFPLRNLQRVLNSKSQSGEGQLMFFFFKEFFLCHWIG